MICCSRRRRWIRLVTNDTAAKVTQEVTAMTYTAGDSSGLDGNPAC
jgi:hypothetical protein